MVNAKGLSYIECTLVVVQISMGGGVPMPLSRSTYLVTEVSAGQLNE